MLWATSVGVCALAAGGFTLSFSALDDLAVASGIDHQLAFLWPLIVDGFIVVATAAAFALRSRGPAVTWYPWLALVLFSAISVVGNSIHAANAARIGVPVPVATVVSAVPAIALLVATHLLVVIVDSRRQPAAGAIGQTVRAATSADQPQRRSGPVAALVRVGEPDVVARLRERRTAGAAITGAVIADLEGVSARTGRRRLEVFREKFPELFETSEGT
ncbi:DUF2637 domain-containing protein [Leifsonia sp. Root112D2]|uniref:DUF2637 domain-containing protein n=1 Tax=Leifsonia sp. Root112D2 TaxID=1736426 RepID=UPI0006F83A40|nr:DUF2637 domain-containing protein [Leifsonia sp. Root112D2]KQV07061.1 hypothetical protein ASC63_06940 [Leifsonia sp. Root112D2]